MLNLKAKWIENAIVVVLGAGDPEMSAIAAACAALGIRTLQAATADGIACRPGNAYTADRYVEGGVYTDDYVISVECAVVDLRVDFAADHHNPGDNGYGRPPAEFWAASSIGQVFNHLLEGGIPATVLVDAFGPERYLVAASDHCPSHAFLGRCPGIDITALKAMRARNSASFNKMSEVDWLAVVDSAIEQLRQLPVATAGGGEYRVATVDIPLLNHAQLIAGIAVQYVMPGNARDPRCKVGLLGGEPEMISAWMAEKLSTGELVDVYGDPQRGYAGGYLPA
jgi:hypothetical protein